jgi:aldehyde:ferredoxin oxidoreductase
LIQFVRFNELCDDFGLDTISTGNVIGFAMEMTEKECYDFQIKFGQEDEYLKIPEEIVYRKPGRGELLALGVKKVSEKVGGKSFAKDYFIKMLQLYYQKRGWDKNGIPEDDTLERLGLLPIKKLLSG